MGGFDDPEGGGIDFGEFDIDCGSASGSDDGPPETPDEPGEDDDGVVGETRAFIDLKAYRYKVGGPISKPGMCFKVGAQGV